MNNASPVVNVTMLQFLDVRLVNQALRTQIHEAAPDGFEISPQTRHARGHDCSRTEPAISKKKCAGRILQWPSPDRRRMAASTLPMFLPPNVTPSRASVEATPTSALADRFRHAASSPILLAFSLAILEALHKAANASFSERIVNAEIRPWWHLLCRSIGVKWGNNFRLMKTTL